MTNAKTLGASHAAHPLRALASLGTVLATIGLAGLLAAHFGLRFMVTPSLPLGVYRTVGGPPMRGAIVMACLPEPAGRLALERGFLWSGACPSGAVPLGKVVLAVAGDSLTLGPEGIRVNGCAVPKSQPRKRDSQGRLLEHYPYGSYVLARGEVWLFSPYHPLSFDSRYFGPVSDAGVLSLLVPVWTPGTASSLPRSSHSLRTGSHCAGRLGAAPLNQLQRQQVRDLRP